jgi:hypothetical protein
LPELAKGTVLDDPYRPLGFAKRSGDVSVGEIFDESHAQYLLMLGLELCKSSSYP